MIIIRAALAVAFILGLLAGPLAGEAQQTGRVPKIGFLATAAPIGSNLEAFRQGLRGFGYVEGQTIAIEQRNAGGKIEQLDGLAGELVRLRPDVIVTAGTQATQAVKRATVSIPIVMALSGDAVGTGLVASLARPGGNVTGLSIVSPELSGKRLELLKEVVPRLSTVAVLWNPADPPRLRDIGELRAAAQRLRITVTAAEVRTTADFEGAFAAVTAARPQALLVLADPLMSASRHRIVAFAARSRLPAMYGQATYVEDGGLIAFGASFSESYRRAAYYVDRILKGAKPGDLPVEQPTKYELVINMKTAKALGLTIPPSVLLRVDQLIE
jgi:putative ABC transport system substrate-binding protein